MATIGFDCEVIIDGNPYFVVPHSYEMNQPRVRKATVRADGGEAYVDLGAGKRVWKMLILCVNDLNNYAGASTGLTGEQYRSALRTSYTGSTGTTVVFVDPLGTSINVHFDGYSEKVIDLRAQQIALASGLSAALSYVAAIELVEA